MMHSNDLPAQEICERFQLGQPTGFSPLGGTRNRNFRLTTDQGKWIVRHRFEGYCQPERVRFDHQAAEFLAEHDVPVVPPLKTDGESLWIHRDAAWEVYRFVEGRPLRDGDRSDVGALARALSRFHGVGKSFTLRCEKIGERGETDPTNISERIDRIERENPDATDVLTSYRSALASAASQLSAADYASLPHTLVHGDVQPANLIMNQCAVAAFVDLDWMAWRPRIYDLGWAILCCCAGHKTPIGEGNIWSLSQSPLLDPCTLQGFVRAYGDLTEAEMAALRPQVVLTWVHIRIGLALKAAPEERVAFLSRRAGEMATHSASGADEWIRSLIGQLEATGTV
jgi:Ser/Thr protein kinase RdoA (MazF antagonist)